MPRRPKGDGETAPKAIRVRKKKESTCSTPGVDLKMEPINTMPFDHMGAGPMAGAPHPMMTGNGAIGMPPNVFPPPPEEMAGVPAAGPAGVGAMPPFSGAPPEYFYQQHHGGPAGPMPPQIPPMATGPNMSAMYGGPPPPLMPPPAPHSQPMPHPGMPPQMPPAPPFNDPSEQSGMLPGPPFMYQHNPNAPPTAMPAGPAMPPHGQPSMIPAHMMLRQFPMTPLGPNFPQQPFLEHRLAEINRRLYTFHTNRHTLPAHDHAQWWEAFSHEFFDDDAKLTVSLIDEADGTNRKYTIGRTLIPRFHRTIFDGGASELFYMLRAPAQERVSTQPWGLCALDCESIVMVTKYERPIPAEVHTECRLFLEFAPFEETVGYRIKHWVIELRHATEFYTPLKENGMESTPELTKTKITRYGLPPAVLHYLKMCLVLEPMQIIMHYSKAQNNAPPTDCLKQLLCHHQARITHQQQQHAQHLQQQQQQHGLPQHMGAGGPMNQPSMSSVPQTPVQDDVAAAGGKKPARKRQRKGANAAAGGAPAASPKKKGAAAVAAAAALATPSPTAQQMVQQQQAALAASLPSQSQPPTAPSQMPPPNAFLQGHPGAFNSAYQEVMVVGEPSMMGCEYGEEDERAISRIENTQYMASAAANPTAGGGMG